MAVYLNKDDLIKLIREYDAWEDYEWSRQDVIDYIVNDEDIRQIEVEDGNDD